MKNESPINAPSSTPQPRFALLHHAMGTVSERRDHWDLMFEHAGVLVTFEIERLPSDAGSFRGRRLADHRLAYLNYEGPISGNRGQVIRLDRGTYQQLPVDEKALCERAFRYVLNGQRLNGTILCDHAIELVPFGQPVLLQAAQWDWHD